MRVRRLLPIILIAAALTVGWMSTRHGGSIVARLTHSYETPVADIHLIKRPRTAAEKIVNGAKMEAIKGVRYDSSYFSISYPNGDAPKDRGACTDVVIRAIRNANFDIQKMIHEDMAAHFSLYPNKWGLSRPDSNIDHRRVPNQMVFLRRFGIELPKSIEGDALKTWQPGDIVYWDLCNGHTGIISNIKNDQGIPVVIHNLGVTCEENCLDAWPIIGHFRYPKS